MLIAVVLGLAQVWTKPNFSTMMFGYERAKWQWDWTFCILWVALAALVIYKLSTLG